MAFHFLNVGNGDCSIIQHGSGRVTMIDCCKARAVTAVNELAKAFRADAAVGGNFNQKDYPENPIEYMKAHGMTSIFRFILSHADMDHMDGIKDVFDTFPVSNFWDTANDKECEFGNNAPYREEDWTFYKGLRGGTNNSVKRLTLYSGADGQFYNRDETNNIGGDGLNILAPTPELMAQANRTEDPNDGSYVILYRTPAGRILLAGDSHDATWEHVLKHHGHMLKNVELMIAPHHGRHSERSFSFLDVVRPRVTLFGNAPAEHLAYAAWSNRGLDIITNNQAGSVIADTSGDLIHLYATNKAFADRYVLGRGYQTFYGNTAKGWYLRPILIPNAQAA